MLSAKAGVSPPQFAGTRTWKDYKLGDLCRNISYGYTESASLEAIGPKFLRITDIVSGRVNWTAVPYCQISSDHHAKYKLQAGDIVIARTGASTGHTYTIKPSDLKHDAIFASYLIRYRVDNKKADPYFVGQLLTSSIWKGFVEGILGGSAQPGANAKLFADFDILLPPLPEQRAIAAVLSSLDDKIDLLHRQNKTLEGLAETIFRCFFVDNQKKTWKESTVDELAHHDKTSISPNRNPSTLFHHYSIPAFDESHMPICELGALIQSNKYKVTEDVILFSKLNPHRDKRLWLVPGSIPENSICSTEFQVIKPKARQYLFFLYGFVGYSENYDQIAAGVGGTSGSHQRIGPEVIFKTKCFLPDDTTLTKYNEMVEGVFKKTHNNRAEMRDLSRLRDMILPKLMSGEVRVNQN